ncbi:MAG: hypothetical protein E7361_03100 [Clostridiales bacterium]|nr:hypothetical protein [Clostridiales bacterium]
MKRSKKLMIIGGILFVIGLVITIIGFTSVFNMKPSMENTGFGLSFLVMIGFVVLGAGLICFFIGVTPHMTKGMLGIHKETLDYVGDDITAVGEKTIDIMEPIAKKSAKVATPIISDFAESVVSGIRKGVTGEDDAKTNTTTRSRQKHCTECGEKINAGDKFCAGCGKKLSTTRKSTTTKKKSE